MKLLTLNTHSLISGNSDAKLLELAACVQEQEYDVIALQEVNQPKKSEIIHTHSPVSTNYAIKNGNYMQKLLEYLNNYSQNYIGVWCGFKESYNRYEEGVGIVTKYPIKDIKTVRLTSGAEREQWKRRYALGIKTDYGEFYSVHFGWWEDETEPFLMQWKRIMRSGFGRNTWIMGDFNAESERKGEGYSLVTSSGFYDTYRLARERDEGYTVSEKIDGWDSEDRKRIDYIFCNFKTKIKRSATVFDGKNYKRISDHFGVEIETE